MEVNVNCNSDILVCYTFAIIRFKIGSKFTVISPLMNSIFRSVLPNF